ncbi:hypothetical protein OROHE_023752 [Orobanche hederae]
MSLLVRARLSAGRYLFPLHSTVPLQQSNLYSSKTTTKTQRLTKSATPAQSPSLSDEINNQIGSTINWPKPVEIPYQAKVANSLNLIGRVKTPVQFDSTSDGNHFAAAVVSQETGGGDDPLLIPVVFEGDLAHVVACHVKEKDRVFVSGQLSTGPMRFAFKDGLGKFHLVAENLNFIEGFVKNVHGNKSGVSFSSSQIENLSVRNTEVVKVVGNDDEEFNQKWKEALENAKANKFSGESDWASTSVLKQSIDESKQENDNETCVESVGKQKNVNASLDLWRALVKSPRQWWDYRGHKSNGLVKEKFPDFKHKETGEGLWLSDSPDWVLSGLEKLEFDAKFMKSVQGGEGLGEKREFNVKFAKAKHGQGGKGEDSWKDLVENPYKWWDNRLGKKNPKSPDFKHKETGEGLWLSDSPDWALPGLEKLEFNVRVMKGKPVQGGEGLGAEKGFDVKFTKGKRAQGGKGEDTWKDLVENPCKWWDNRLGKKNPKSPDFKHKETGEGLWLSDSPDWALPGLEKLEFDARVMKGKPVQGGEGLGAENGFDKFTKGKRAQGGKGEDTWKDLVENPYKWWDNRLGKKNPKSPDFKHKETGEGLWLSDSPDWALPGLEKLEFNVRVMKGKPMQGGEGLGAEKEFDVKFTKGKHTQGGKGEDTWKDLVENPYKWWDNRLGKKNPKSPDFKHKETGEGLWLNDSPNWALSKLPVLTDGKKNMHAV